MREGIGRERRYGVGEKRKKRDEGKREGPRNRGKRDERRR